MKWISLFLILTISFAQANIVTDDTHLSPEVMPFEMKGNDFFRADKINYIKLENPNALEIEIVLNNIDKTQTIITGLKHEIWLKGQRLVLDTETTSIEWDQCGQYPNELGRGMAVIEHELWSLENHKNEEYDMLYKAKCGHKTQLVFNYDTYGGGAFTLWDTMDLVIKKLTEIDRMDFWTSKIGIVWPDGGNFYDFSRVHLDKAWKWDIVGHEIGHAIFDRANVGLPAGGEHFIDRCYGDGLAYSEGWASFFSAWLRVELDDPNAQFEYMVPRRSPLTIEFVPDDVCKGSGNEWRVYSYLWDLIDLNDDGENVKLTFTELWDVTRDLGARSITTVRQALQDAGYDPVLLNVVWDQTIMGL